MRSIVPINIAGTILCVLLKATSVEAQATRTWVSGVGDDANPCSRTAPCKTFAGAISKTVAGGEINCLDPGGFGAVTITRSITIDCKGTFGSILAAGTNGVNINDAGTTPGTIVVNLKHLSINGANSGLIGINFISGLSLHLDNVTIENFNSGTAVGLRFAPSNAGARFLHVNDSYIWNNGIPPSTGGGILIQPTAAGAQAVAVINNTAVEFGAGGIIANATTAGVVMTVNKSRVAHNRGGGITSSNGARTMVTDTVVIDNSGIGVSSATGSTVRIFHSTIFGNQTGVGGGATILSYKNNAINGNGADGTPITQENQN